ncbi:MAG: sugar ABC transporter ATP-binding protein, partial [Proteobacteria bacterium]|nr:sugar ABC transporter ATP-binding protein [Pseudomonadota bacterium]
LGKSTLVKIINGVYKKDSGNISLFGDSSDYNTPEGALKAGIAMVFQDLSLIPSLTVAQNIFLQSHPFKKGILIDDKKGDEKARELLTLIGVDTEISPSDRVEDLSVGKQQIIEIAKALSHNPKVLILDEPTASLSSAEIESLFNVVETLKSRGISIIYITHYLQDIFKICDSLTLLRDGRIIFREETSDIDLKYLVDAMAGGESDAVSWNRTRAERTGTPLLELKNVSTEKIRNVDLKIYPGEIVGVAGLLGSGRSELLRAMFGIDRLQNGQIILDGKQVEVTSSAKAIDEGITLVPENRREQGLVLDFPVSDNVVLSI